MVGYHGPTKQLHDLNWMHLIIHLMYPNVHLLLLQYTCTTAYKQIGTHPGSEPVRVQCSSLLTYIVLHALFPFSISYILILIPKVNNSALLRLFYGFYMDSRNTYSGRKCRKLGSCYTSMKHYIHCTCRVREIKSRQNDYAYDSNSLHYTISFIGKLM